MSYLGQDVDRFDLYRHGTERDNPRVLIGTFRGAITESSQESDAERGGKFDTKRIRVSMWRDSRVTVQCSIDWEGHAYELESVVESFHQRRLTIDAVRHPR